MYAVSFIFTGNIDQSNIPPVERFVNRKKINPMKTYHQNRGLLEVAVRLSKFASAALVGFALLATTLDAEAQTVAVVRSFESNGLSAYPLYVTLTQGRDGNLYGTTLGTTLDFGSVFRLQANGALINLYSFSGTTQQGSAPGAGLTLGSDGNFYGTTTFGGSINNGILFRITPAGVFTVLHDFEGGSDGGFPEAPPIQASDCNFYGTTIGSPNSTVYKYTPAGNFSTVYQFDGTDGQSIQDALIQGTDGNLYGSTYSGGTNSCGTIFKMTRSGTILFSYSFPCGARGAGPIAGLVQASDGNFYGTTSSGGTSALGTVFKMTTRGAVSILHSFQGGSSDGATPASGLVQGTDGNLYGSTVYGGSENMGTLFKITTTGSCSMLYSFVSSVGTYPQGGLTQDTTGQFYGTAQEGGAGNAGSVFSLNMALSPFVTFVRPTGGVTGTAQILGQGLTGTTAVTFKGVAATSFKVLSDTYLTAVIPVGAVTGLVQVTTPAGTLTSNRNFQIIAGTSNSVRQQPKQPISHAAKKTN